MTCPSDTILLGDCVAILRDLAAEHGRFVDLAFADPPFNIGYRYDVYEDRKAYDEYHAWTRDWMQATTRVLTETGSFWVAIGDEYAAEVRMIGRELDLTLRNWVIWHYTFGQNTRTKFARSHAHLFYFTMHPREFTFNDQAVRTFSDRERVYRDKRANRNGRIPDDTWGEFPRLCGTFGEREGWHPCQMPEPLLGRIVRACSHAGDTVLDPFAGSGTTLVAARRNSRHGIGIELSPDYAQSGRQRLERATPLAELADCNGQWPGELLDLLNTAYGEFAISTTRLRDNPMFLERFTERFNARLAVSGVAREFSAEEVWGQLERLRAQTKLMKIRVHAEEPSGPARPWGR
jgi:site-specific DNA-methyltransferase (adenine-specific)